VLRDCTIVLLPGLDGSSELSRRFLDVKPAGSDVMALALPHEPFDSYAELAERLLPSLPSGPALLIGNSFSGPLALRLANLVPAAGLVLCTTFVTAPVPRVFARPLSLLAGVSPSALGASILLTDGDIELAEDLALAVARVPRHVVASRIRLVMNADATGDLARCTCPLLYLRATNDLLISERQLALIREIRPDVESRDLDAGHLVLQALPRSAWAHIDDFKARATARSVA